MKKVAIYFGSTTGTCESMAYEIADALGIERKHVYNVTELTAERAETYDVLILGSATWGCGDLQDDWYDGVKILKKANLNNKTIALFSCGDAESYGDTFCEAMAHIRQAVLESGCHFIGKVSAEDYHFSASEAVEDGHFIGLALDEVNESHLTAERITRWVQQIKPYLE